jgi:putative transcriptional regulator
MMIENQKDSALLEELGLRLAQARLDHNWTQEDLATSAAVSKRTIERLEIGKSVQVSNLVRVLGALDLTRNLEQLVPPGGARPIEQLKHQGKGRRRASSSKQGSATAWTWDDKT